MKKLNGKGDLIKLLSSNSNNINRLCYLSTLTNSSKVNQLKDPIPLDFSSRLLINNNNENSSSKVADLDDKSINTRYIGRQIDAMTFSDPMKMNFGILDAYLRGILKAQSVVYDVCKETDLQYAPSLSAKLQNHIYFKREDQQPVFSFKLRGAYNRIAGLSGEKRKNGIVTCSAGNHAQGVALSASRLKIDNIIVMPLATPQIKVDAVRKFGGNVKLFGNNYDEAQAEAIRLRDSQGRTLIHPFDDPEVICGQGTIGMEILKQAGSKEIDAIFCCVGGGGLLAGVAAYVKRVNSNIRMIGVEAKDAAAMAISFEKDAIVSLNQVGLFADGAAVRTPGSNTFELIRALSDGIVTTNTDEICAAIKLIFGDTRFIPEPAGALSVAGAIKYIQATGVKGKSFVCVTSGANMDFDRLRFVSERADSSESFLAVRIPERPGAFFELSDTVHPRKVTEFSYRAAGSNGSNLSSDAFVFMSVQVSSKEDYEKLENSLKMRGYGVRNLDNDELVKVHIRHMCGGRAPGITDERLFRFEFPEKPGALKSFLEGLFLREKRTPWNVSLFHYRNHGADIGRVLAGLQVPSSESKQFEEFLNNLDFVYNEETQNQSYIDFLR